MVYCDIKSQETKQMTKYRVTQWFTVETEVTAKNKTEALQKAKDSDWDMRLNTEREEVEALK